MGNQIIAKFTKKDRITMDIQKEIERRFNLQEEYLGTDKPVNRIKPVVSVRVQTYQHSPYIAQCLDGILMQKTDFPFEVLVGEDESTDGTREICIEYAKKHPGKIRLFLRDRKLSQLYDENGKLIKRLNGMFNVLASRGKYMAICEGDDYWTDQYKLQKQVDFLENNGSYIVCCHETKVIYEDVRGNSKLFSYSKGISRSGDIKMENALVSCPCHTCSIMVNTSSFDYYSLDGYTHLGRDYPILIIWTSIGKVYYINEVMSVHRKNPGGLTYNRTPESSFKANLETIRQLNDYLPNFKIKSKYMKSIWFKYAVLNVSDISLLRKVYYYIYIHIYTHYIFPASVKKLLLFNRDVIKNFLTNNKSSQRKD